MRAFSCARSVVECVVIVTAGRPYGTAHTAHTAAARRTSYGFRDKRSVNVVPRLRVVSSILRPNEVLDTTGG